MGKTIARIKIKADRVKDFLSYVSTLAELTRMEKGCLFYELYQMEDDETIFFFIEEWSYENDLHLHLQSVHVKEFEERMSGIADSEPEPFRWKRVV